MTRKNFFYLPILNELKTKTNLSKIQKKLSISKQKLNYYIRGLKKQGFIIQKGRGWYEVTNKVKDLTKYDNFLSKDISRGHGYVWEIKFPQEIQDWDKRIDKLKEKGIHYTLVGALKTTPRIKILGRKVWLCNDHIRIFDKKNNSYYGTTAKESKYYALKESLLIVGVLNNKLGINLREIDLTFKKEHYALIKNDLAIEHNKKGEIIRISDKFGEWLLIDDSLEQGGEMETIGKKSYPTNIKLQKWWNDKKEHDFKITDTFLLERMNQVTENQMAFAKNLESHIEAIKTLSQAVKELKEEIKKFKKK